VNAQLAGRHAMKRPLLFRYGEGIVQRRFSGVKIAEQGDQGGKNLPRFGAVEGGQSRRQIAYTEIAGGEPLKLYERWTPTGC